MSCIDARTCIYVGGFPQVSLWSGFPILVILLAAVLDAILGGIVGRVRRTL